MEIVAAGLLLIPLWLIYSQLLDLERYLSWFVDYIRDPVRAKKRQP